ncbi:hypothetical protein [Draconibacterium sp.]|uniref:hypothetical protein n=1 Tax=Draconibacterium sp. TaxID=1965318 RepID=UPI00356A66AC
MSIHSDNPEVDALFRKFEKLQKQNAVISKRRSKVFDREFRKQKPMRHFILKIRELSIVNIIGISILFGILFGIAIPKYSATWRDHELTFSQEHKMLEERYNSKRTYLYNIDYDRFFNTKLSIITSAAMIGFLFTVKKK